MHWSQDHLKSSFSLIILLRVAFLPYFMLGDLESEIDVKRYVYFIFEYPKYSIIRISENSLVSNFVCVQKKLRLWLLVLLLHLHIIIIKILTGSTVNSPSPSRKSTGSSCCLAHRVNFNNQPFPVEEIGRYGLVPGASDGPLKPLSPSRKSAAYLGSKTF